MKISRLEIKNFIGIKDLTMDPGKVNIIKGKNAQGKTSVLEAIEKAFTNNDRRPKVIREGAESALILIETDDGLTIRRSVTDKGTNLTVKNKEGFAAPAPQKLLAGISGQFSFNPVDFLNKDDKEQAQIILSVAPIKVTPEDVEAWTGQKVTMLDYTQHGLQVVKDLHAMFYDQRRMCNAQVKASKAEVDSIEIPEGFNPEEYRNVNLRELYDELKTAQDTNKSIRRANIKLQNMKQREELIIAEARSAVDAIVSRTAAQCEVLKEKIIALRNQIEAIQKAGENEVFQCENARRGKLVLLKQERADCKATLAETKPIDTQPLELKVQDFQDKQRLVALFDHKLEASKRYSSATSEALALDHTVKMLAEKPAELVKQAALPIKDLGIDEKGNITIAGRPVRSLSTSEQIRLALDIARATAGGLQLICVDGWESLDKYSQDAFLKEIEKDEYQYFITAVSDNDLEISKREGPADGQTL